MRFLLLIFVAGFAALSNGIAVGALAQPASPIMGRWLSASGNGVIEIYACGDRLCGKLVWLSPKAPSTSDGHNSDPALRNRPLCGLVMLGDFHQTDPGEWGDGWVYSPENGKTYSATLRLERANVLKLRGYVGIPLFGETQTWTRADPGLGSC